MKRANASTVTDADILRAIKKVEQAKKIFAKKTPVQVFYELLTVGSINTESNSTKDIDNK